MILATGACEQMVPFPGWTQPGVMTVGAAQLLAKRHGLTPGKRVLVAGSGPLLLPAAAKLAELGVQVVGGAQGDASPCMASFRSGGMAKLGPLRRGLALLASQAASAHPVPLRAQRRDGAGARTR